jgi:hypothetical protein
MDADEHRIEGRIHPGTVDPDERLHRRAYEDDDGGRCQGVFDKNREPGEKAAGGAHRLTGKAVASASGGNRRGHFREGQHQRQVHHRHQHGRDGKASPAGFCNTEVPAGEVAGDYIGHPEASEQNRPSAAALELPFGQIGTIVMGHGHSSTQISTTL